jgi:hypothetical protein
MGRVLLHLTKITYGIATLGGVPLNGRAFVVTWADVTSGPNIRERHQIVATDFGPRSRDICRLHKEYAEDCKKRGKLLPLTEWSDEKEHAYSQKGDSY